MDMAPTLDQLREELRRAIEETSGREVARELSVSPTGLKKFTDNPHSSLYGKTLRKVIPWGRERPRASRGHTTPAPPGLRSLTRWTGPPLLPVQWPSRARRESGSLHLGTRARGGGQEHGLPSE